MHMSRSSNSETASKFVVQKKCNMLKFTNQGVNVEIRQRQDYSRMQFLTAVSHSIPWVLTQKHCDLAADMGARRHGQGGACAPPWKIPNVFKNMLMLQS